MSTYQLSPLNHGSEQSPLTYRFPSPRQSLKVQGTFVAVAVALGLTLVGSGMEIDDGVELGSGVTMKTLSL